MPWCERCDRFLNPNTIHADGTCPSCGRPVDGPAAPGPSGTVGVDHAESAKAPWHFWVMVVGVVVYLGWRLVEGLLWVLRSWF
ncbi:MAG: hypothetical protein U5K29_01995 [Acidimicrobiales bacterium]|nr:hypothetical protein [Acidimicrobiales bacterium]